MSVTKPQQPVKVPQKPAQQQPPTKPAQQSPAKSVQTQPPTHAG